MDINWNAFNSSCHKCINFGQFDYIFVERVYALPTPHLTNQLSP